MSHLNNIFLGIIFIIAISLVYYDKKNNTHYMVNLFLYSSWILAVVFFMHLTGMSPSEDYLTLSALAPFGIIIAAFVASASVMKNIAETKENEAKKHAKEDSKFYLEKCISYLKEVDDLIGKLPNDKFSWAQAAKILISMREISGIDYITNPTHQKIFTIEYTNYRFKLFRSMINLSEDRKADHIKPAFFCSVSDWRTKDLADAFAEKGFKMDPKHVITVMKFAQVEGNSFLEETGDYSDWRSYNLDKLGWKAPMTLIIDYIEMYKEKIPEKPKDQQ